MVGVSLFMGCETTPSRDVVQSEGRGQLPGMDGLAAAVLLKNNPSTASIPIVALTA